MKDMADITILLDRSGSMGSIASDVVGGINEFVRIQKEADGEAVLSRIQFDSFDHRQIDLGCVPIGDVSDMAGGEFSPRGATPLLDAVGFVVVETGERLAKMDEGERPDKVIFVIFTDGKENGSREYTKGQIAEMVKKQEGDFNWKFIFLGAGIDAFAEGGGIGMGIGTTANVSRENVTASLRSTSQNLVSYRGGAGDALEYSDIQRKEME